MKLFKINLLRILLSASCFSLVSSEVLFAQELRGGEILGENMDERAGSSVSMPSANTVAAGAPLNTTNGRGSGQVRVYGLQGGMWIQKGSSMNGENVDDFFGAKVDMPTNNTIVVSSNGNDDNAPESGKVYVYDWSGVDWIQRGNAILGQDSYDFSGTSVSMPDSNTLAIGTPGGGGIPSIPYGRSAGYVSIYKWNGANWTLKGNVINGQNIDDLTGYSVSMPDSNTIAVGDPLNDANGSGAGRIRIFRWNGTSWVLKGNSISGEHADDGFGTSISMPDSNTVAVGSIFNDGNGNGSGHTRIFQWNGTSWVQKGNDIDGESQGDQSGYSVSMPTPDFIAIGAPANAGGSVTKGPGGFGPAGHARIYQWNGTSWVQRGIDIDGYQDNLGGSVSMPDTNTVAVGAPVYDLGRGKIMVLENFCSSTSMILANECESYTSPSGNYIWNTSGIYTDTVINSNGCDSIITINLTIDASSELITISVCDFYISPSGNYTWMESGIYKDTILNAKGCDSIITIDLMVDQPTGNISIEACDQYISPSGSYTWITSGIYLDTVMSSGGCDSVITVNLLMKDTNEYVSGIITTSQGNPLINSKVYLIGFDSDNDSVYKLDSSVTDISGKYLVKTNNQEEVYIKAVPDSQTYPNEIPTYYTSILTFLDADEIPTIDCDTIEADVQTIAGQNPGGSGFISGNINKGAGKLLSCEGEPVVRLSIILMNNNNQPVQYTQTDAQGNFEFSNLALGEYRIWADDPNINNTNPPAYTISSEEQQLDDIVMKYSNQLENCVNNNTTNLVDESAILWEVFPNPVSDKLNITIRGGFTIKLLDITGKVLLEEIAYDYLSLNFASISRGIYLLEISKEQNTYYEKVIKK